MAGRRLRFAACLVVALVATVAGGVQQAGATSANLVISQVYGGGGNSGSTLTHDYIELFNRGSGAVSLSGMSLQYASATGTGNFGSSTTLITELPAVSVDAGQYFLVREASGSSPEPSPTFTADYVDATPINMSATSGKVALVSDATPLGCNGSTASPCSAAQLARIVDLVGYGGANFFEGAGPTPALSSTNAAFRANDGCTDTDNNAADFTVTTAAPRNTTTTLHACDTTTPTNPSGTGAVAPNTVAQGGAVTVTVAVTPGANPTSTGLSVSADLTSIGGGATQPLFDDGTNGDLTAGDNTFTYATSVAPATGEGIKTLPFTIGDAQGRSGSGAIMLGVTQVVTTTTAIHDIQGSAHRSPLVGQTVANVHGIVTAKAANGYYMQDPNPDTNEATSEGIFVFTSPAPSVNVGDAVSVNARVQEFRPGGSGGTTNLTTTELSSATTTILSSGSPLPAATVVGTGGRIPPDTVIEDDATGDVETSGTFDPSSDGLDFWESLEGMRVQLNNPVAVGPTNAFGETQVVGDDGANASVRTPRGGVIVRPNDFNPERVVADDAIVPLPAQNVGDHYTGPLVGVLDYNFGNYFLEVTQAVDAIHNGVTPETTDAPTAEQVAIGTFNFENLAPSDPPTKFARLAEILVHDMKAPDIVSGEEVQDNTGATDDHVVASDQTLAKLVDAIKAAGGPTYDYREIDPVDDQDGGQPGGNIRQVFLFRTDRGVSFVDRPGGDSTSPNAVVGSGTGTHLLYSPGRIAPADNAWASSRKPLAGEFMFHGTHLFVIANHFNSKGGDQPLEGRFQPPTRSSEVQRHQQAQLVHDFVASILAADPNANVVVDGDLNDFDFSDTVSILKSGVLTDLMDSLPPNERYSYVFEGNSQALDHILVSSPLDAHPLTYDVVHVNAEFADQASDHDPSVVRIALNGPPTVSAGGPYAVDEGGAVTLAASASDPNGDPLTYAWDLDGNGTFETPGSSVQFSAAGLDGPSTRTIAVQVGDGLAATTAEATVTIRNVPPTAQFGAETPAFAGLPFHLSLTAPTDPSAADTAAGFSYAFDCGGGYGSFGTAATAACTSTSVGPLTVRGKIRDKDGGVTEYTAQVQVTVTYASLCTLVGVYSSDPQTTAVLCDKLEQARTASTDTARAGALGAFRNQVDAKTGTEPGKAFTADEGATLDRLALSLQ